jgi:uncharacterized protein
MEEHVNLTFAGKEIAPGQTADIALPMPEFFDVPMQMPVRVVRARNPGPRVVITSTIHGDEINGIEVIRRLFKSRRLEALVKGDVIIVPVVNMYGYIMMKRELPAGRDLNRCFPGKERGTLASRLAHFLIKEVLCHCTHGIDLHSGTENHMNLPQIRIDFENEECIRLAHAFAAPVTLKADLRKGSLREWFRSRKSPPLLFEGSEAKRIDDHAAETGAQGIIGVLAELGMLEKLPGSRQETLVCGKSGWVRAPASGVFITEIKAGDRVEKGKEIGMIADLLGHKIADVSARATGLVIGMNLIPTVNEGDALFHIGWAIAEGTTAEVNRRG